MTNNRKTSKAFITMMLGLIITTFFATANATTNIPVGYWKTVDDKTGEVLSIVQIFPAKDDTLEGKIVKIMPVLGQKTTDRCIKCPGVFYNKPNLGLTIMWDMRKISDTTWGDGHVLDPKSGNIYRGKMTLVNDGHDLRLRGYIGLPIFGRTETWIRTGKP